MPIPDFVVRLRRSIGHELMLLPSVDAVVFNDAGEVLLHRRADTRKWALISGIIEPGETPAAAAVREVREETAVSCTVDRVAAVHSTPVIHYPNGDSAQYVVTTFVCRATGGTPRVNDESLDVRYWRIEDVPDLRDNHAAVLRHVLSGELKPMFDGAG